MQLYQNVLVCVDIFSEYQKVLDKASALVSSPSQMSLVYASFPLAYYESYGFSLGSDIVYDNQKAAKDRLLSIAKEAKIPQQQAYAPVGSAVEEIHALSEKIHADLIVIGTHGQSGWKLLLGSTANGVLHGVKCDVLAVRM